MPELTFAVEAVEPLLHAAAPALVFKLRVERKVSQGSVVGSIQSILLRCQLRIEPARRRHDASSGERLSELFGESHRWNETMKSMFWTHATTVVSGFEQSIVVDLVVPCGYDFSLAATKYFYALDGGDVPISLLFSGTLFYFAGDGRLQVAQLPWDADVDYRLPVRVWQDLVDHYYPNSVPLWLSREAFERLYAFKRQSGVTGWDQALNALCDAATAEVSE